MNLPNHVGIIVDGNGRWAVNNGLSRSAGHKEGADNIERLIKYVKTLDISILSLYVFSTENFKRSEEEVSFLMDLLVTLFEKRLMNVDFKVLISGRRDNVSDKVLNAIDKVVENTKNNTGLIVNFCFNYGGQYEIIDACNKLIGDGIKNVNLEIFNKYLYNELPNLDLLIRTGGEKRISNFLLFQAAYAEFYFVDTYFPEFDESCFEIAMKEFSNRDRRYGAVNYKGDK